MGTTREYQARDPAEIEELGDPDQPLKLVRVERRCVEEGYELYKRGYGGGQGAAVEGKWKEGHVPDTSLVMQLVRLTLELVGDSCSLAVRGATPSLFAATIAPGRVATRP